MRPLSAAKLIAVSAKCEAPACETSGPSSFRGPRTPSGNRHIPRGSCEIGRSIVDAMERARPTWTDERLDDLSKSVDRVDADLRHLRAEMSVRFDAVNSRFDALHRLIVQTSGGMIIAVLATLVSVLVTRA